MRQHQGGHDLQTKEEWMELHGKMKPDFPCMLCGIRESHGVNPNKNPNDMQGCHMWFSNSKATQADHFCKLVRETRLYGSSGVAGKSRWKSASWTNSWKDSKVPEPSSNIPMRCPFPGCNEVFWKQYLRKHIHKKHGNSTTFTPDYSTMSMFPHEHDYVKRLFQNPGQPLTSICPKKNANYNHGDMVQTFVALRALLRLATPQQPGIVADAHRNKKTATTGFLQSCVDAPVDHEYAATMPVMPVADATRHARQQGLLLHQAVERATVVPAAAVAATAAEDNLWHARALHASSHGLHHRNAARCKLQSSF